MGLFSKKPSADKLLSEALCDYKASRFDVCFQKVCEAAELGSPRAHFCKALLLYNDNVHPNSNPDPYILEETVSRAVNGGYAPAYGFYAFILDSSKQYVKLCEFLEKKSKVKDGTYLSYKASYLLGLYTDDEKADGKTTISVLKEAVALLSDVSGKINSGKGAEYEECELYNPYGVFSVKYAYPRANFLLQTAYYCEDDWNDRKAFMAAFEEVVKYMPDPCEKLRATLQYLEAVLNNRLGMSDISEAHRAMRILNECFGALDENQRKSYEEDYDEIYDKYVEFCDNEKEKIRNRDITYSDGYVDMNALSASSVASAILHGAASWANSSSSNTKTVYTINGIKYTRGEFGYLYDENGFKSTYRVDDYSRLYDGNDTELGYYNNDGLFIES